MGKIIAIANHKGGVGKTTSVASLGVALSQKGKKVLLIDLDAQGNLTSLFIHDAPERTIFEAMTGNKILPIIHITDNKNLDIVPSSLDLVGIEKALSILVHDDVKELTILRNLLEPKRDSYDYILIDCPPSLGILTKNALTASDGVIITLTAESLPTKGLTSLIDAILMTRRGLNKTLSLFGILITRYNRRKINRLVEATLRESFEDVVFTTKIRENVDIMESPLYGMDIYSYSPDSIGAKDYSDLANEIINKHF